ncbi:hypothetical protein [Oceanobacillus sp. FSL W7-1309]|uniref:hypothetical protein n=1 Tax=Oceanobacillus sp. FSL W7-1309 TaxID=2954539 RepID=UPI0030FA72A6
MGVVASFLVSAFAFNVSAAVSRVIGVTPYEAQEIGLSFETSESITRSELVNFLHEIEYAESSEDALDNVRFGIAAGIVTYPLSNFGISIGASGASGLLSIFIISNDLGSRGIQTVLNSSTADNFLISIEYERGNRGQDYWYEASDISVVPN